MKKKKICLAVLAAVFFITAPTQIQAQAETVAVETVINTGQETKTSDILENGLNIEENRKVYYEKGTRIKNRWKNWSGSRYYFGADGYAYTGSHKIGKKVYVFDEQGRLLKNRKNKLVTVYGKKYCMATKAGNPRTGYFVYRNNLYYADSLGSCYQNRSTQKGKFYFTDKGTARKNTDVQLKIQTMQIVSKITKSNMSRGQKLRACWKYAVDRSRFSYGGSDPNLKKKGWYRETALAMLKTKRGNCYSFACAFAALAREVGYKNIKIKVGYDHCWVTINGKHYDPQTQWSGWIPGVYGLKAHPTGPYVKKTYDFMK